MVVQTVIEDPKVEGNVSDEDAVTELSSEADENPPEDTEEEMIITVWHTDTSATDEIIDSPVDEWIESVGFETTEEVPIPERLVDQVIGQNAASAVIRKAAEQRRHMMMIGDPGTGKSMLKRSMTELLPKDTLVDVLCYLTKTRTNLESGLYLRVEAIRIDKAQKEAVREYEKNQEDVTCWFCCNCLPVGHCCTQFRRYSCCFYRILLLMFGYMFLRSKWVALMKREFQGLVKHDTENYTIY